jgi:hypothetical protein
VYNNFMPKLAEITEKQRIAAVLQTITLIQSGMTLTQALEVTNLSLTQYYDWINKGEETIEMFYHMIDQQERRELSVILSERETLIEKALTKAKAEKASIYDILSVVTYMDKRKDEIESRQGVTDNAEIKAKRYLTGPMVQIQSSRLSATGTVEEDGSISLKIQNKPNIIDGELVSSPNLVPSQESKSLDEIQDLDPFAHPEDLDLPINLEDLE